MIINNSYLHACRSLHCCKVGEDTLCGGIENERKQGALVKNEQQRDHTHIGSTYKDTQQDIKEECLKVHNRKQWPGNCTCAVSGRR